MDLSVLLGIIALPFVLWACRGAYLMTFPKPGMRRWSAALSCVISLLIVIEVFRIGGVIFRSDEVLSEASPAIDLCTAHFETGYQCRVEDMTEKEPSIGVIYMFGQANKMVNGTCFARGPNRSLRSPDSGQFLVRGCGYKAYCIVRQGAVVEARITGLSHWPGGVDCRPGETELRVLPADRSSSLEKQMRGAP